MTVPPTNYELLVNGGCIDPQAVNGLSAPDRTAFLESLESLTQTEVQTMISAREKLGQRVCLWWI